MKFIVYSKDGCPYCTKIVQVFEMSNIDHEVYKLNVDYNKEEFYTKFGYGSTFPQVTLNGNSIGGCSDTIKYLKENELV